MSDFAYKHPIDYRGYPYELSLPEDLYVEDNQMPELDVSFMLENAFWGANVGTSGLEEKFSEPEDYLLCDAYENSCLHQDYWRNEHEIYFTGFPSEPLCNVQFPMGYHERPNHVVPGKCIDKDYHSEGTLHEAKNFGSSFGRSKNSNLMEKDSTHIFKNDVDHFSSGYNALGKPFEDFPDRINTCVDYLAQSFIQSERQKQNTSTRAETKENYISHPNCWGYGEQLKVELQEAISLLTACVGRLEVQVERLTHQVQDMADKISGENKFTGPISDHSGDSKAILVGSETISSADESKLFIETEDSSQKPVETGCTDDSHTSASDWEII